MGINVNKFIHVLFLIAMFVFGVFAVIGWHHMADRWSQQRPLDSVEVISVYDGDTFKCNIDGWPDIIGERINIRVKGIDTPELDADNLREKESAKEARDYVAKLVLNAKHVQLKNIERGKYFRIVADVYVDGVNLGDDLLEKDLAEKYDE